MAELVVVLATIAAMTVCVLLQYEGLVLTWKWISSHRGNRRAKVVRSFVSADPSTEIKSFVRPEISLRKPPDVPDTSKMARGCRVKEVPNNSQFTIVSSSPRRSRLRMSRSCAITQFRQALRRVDKSEGLNSGGRISLKKAKTCCTSL